MTCACGCLQESEISAISGYSTLPRPHKPDADGYRKDSSGELLDPSLPPAVFAQKSDSTLVATSPPPVAVHVAFPG